jgi:diguanylate cyclase (GGDEF)-like protein/PAS domain S-box-containing protein
MTLQTKFFAFVAPALLATAVLTPAVWYFQLENRPMTAEVIAVTVLMTVGLICTALLTIYFAASRLVCRPIRHMASEMNRLAAGSTELKPLPEAQRGDELGIAAQAFNQVVDTVQWTTRALQAANSDLEQRVNQRTAELAHRNTELVFAESKFRSIFENATDGIFQTTPDGRPLAANPAMVRLLGYDSEEECLACLTDVGTQIYVNPQARREFAERMLFKGGIDQFETEFRRRDGTQIWVSTTGHVVRDENGQPKKFEGFVRDITQRKRSDWLDQDRRVLLEMTARNEPLTQTLQAVCSAAERQCPHVRAMVLLCDGNRRQIGAAPQLSPGFVLALDEMLGLVNDSQQNGPFDGSAAFVPDITVDSRWSSIIDAAATEDLLAYHSLPITAGHGKLLGELVLLQSISTPLDENNLASMQSLAGLAGLAIGHHQLTNRLEHDAVHDPLTGLPNRAQLESQLPQWVGAAARYHRSLAVLMIDLDGFKTVNDTLGHTTGDGLLRQVAGRLSQAIRGSDVLVRMGGDEFNLVATEMASADDAMILGDRLIQALAAPFSVEGRELFVTASIGIAVFPQDGADSATLQRSADAAMYAAKAAGRNRAILFDPKMGDAALDRLELEGQLRRAISNNELFLEYQPQVDAAGAIVGVEALVRWQHSRLGRIPPTRFIPLAEQCGLILQIGAWVLREACWQARAWQDMGRKPVSVAVNVSALQFQQTDFVEIVASALNDTALDPRYLELELTESLLMANTADAVEKVAAIRAMGVGMSIDDFGTGYSSLAYLRRLPIDRLKIDQSFVHELGDGPQIDKADGRAAIITAITSLATNLGKQVVAEGVETAAQRDYLIQIGCHVLQGYLFSKPVRANQIEEMLRYSNNKENVAAA